MYCTSSWPLNYSHLIIILSYLLKHKETLQQGISAMKDRDHKDRAAATLLPEISIKFLVMAVLFLLSVFVFSYIVYEGVIYNKVLFDTRVSQFFSMYTSPQVIRLMKLFTFFGSSGFLLPAYTLLIILLFINRKMTIAINVAIVALSSTALTHILKRAFHRQRPDSPLIESLKTYSFPSGHTLSSFIFCCILIYLIWNMKITSFGKWLMAVLLILVSVATGLSRIILKVHYPTDVIASFCLGIVWVSLSFPILNRLNKILPAHLSW